MVEGHVEIFRMGSSPVLGTYTKPPKGGFVIFSDRRGRLINQRIRGWVYSLKASINSVQRDRFRYSLTACDHTSVRIVQATSQVLTIFLQKINTILTLSIRKVLVIFYVMAT